MTFSFGVYVYTHYYWWFCMVKGMQASMFVGCQTETVVGIVQSANPSGQARLRD